jgi:hypothetical protein
MTTFSNDDSDYLKDEAKRYNTPDYAKALDVAQEAVKLAQESLAIARENTRLAQQAADDGREALRLVKERLQKGNQ